MQLFAPAYYPRFACIADRCRHSCCIGWEIDVDSDTLCRYEHLSDGYGACVRESIVTDEDGVAHFALADGERCPHLDERGLCRIILSLGKDCLCDICREHPRFYNETPHGLEVGLGMACEEAARLILSSDDYAETVTVEQLEGEPLAFDFDATEHRRALYEILSSNVLTYEQKTTRIAEMHGVSPASYDDNQWRELLSGLEYMDEGHRALFAAYASAAKVSPDMQKILERALAYWLYRHATAAADPDAFSAAVGLCLFFERLLCSLLALNETADLAYAVESARVISEELEYSEQNTATIRAMFESNS